MAWLVNINISKNWNHESADLFTRPFYHINHRSVRLHVRTYVHKHIRRDYYLRYTYRYDVWLWIGSCMVGCAGINVNIILTACASSNNRRRTIAQLNIAQRLGSVKNLLTYFIIQVDRFTIIVSGVKSSEEHASIVNITHGNLYHIKSSSYCYSYCSDLGNKY